MNDRCSSSGAYSDTILYRVTFACKATSNPIIHCEISGSKDFSVKYNFSTLFNGLSSTLVSNHFFVPDNKVNSKVATYGSAEEGHVIGQVHENVLLVGFQLVNFDPTKDAPTFAKITPRQDQSEKLASVWFDVGESGTYAYSVTMGPTAILLNSFGENQEPKNVGVAIGSKDGLPRFGELEIRNNNIGDLRWYLEGESSEGIILGELPGTSERVDIVHVSRFTTE